MAKKKGRSKKDAKIKAKNVEVKKSGSLEPKAVEVLGATKENKKNKSKTIQIESLNIEPIVPVVNINSRTIKQQKLKAEKLKNAERKLERSIKRNRKRIAKKQNKLPLWAKIVIIVLSLSLVLVISVAIVGYMILSHTTNVFKGNPMDILIGTELAKDENGLTNILVFGTSEDAEGHGGELLTDSIMVTSIDQKNKKSKMFNIPRDLWVNYKIPGGDTMNCVVGTQGKINATYMCALNELQNKDQAARYFVKKISEITGLDLQYYIALDWGAMKTIVDEIGGIDVDVHSDDERGIYDSCQHLSLSRGMNYNLDGKTALKLARARNAGCDTGGDFGLTNSNFDREINQQRIFNAIKAKTLSIGILANPTRVIRLLDSLGNNVKTNIAMVEVRTLLNIATDMKEDVISISTASEFSVGRIGVQSVVVPKNTSSWDESSMFSYGDFQRYLREKLLN